MLSSLFGMTGNLPSITIETSEDYLVSTQKQQIFMPFTWNKTRGMTWRSCSDWFDTMPGSLFQLTCFFFFLAFMGGGKNNVAAVYNHVMCACAFLVFVIFGAVDTCSLDMVVWGMLLVVVNIVQVSFLLMCENKTD